MGIKLSEIKDKKTRALVEAEIARCGYSKSKRTEQNSLDGARKIAPRMVNIDGALLVRITRVCKSGYDDDNFVAGCKTLRDAIAALVSRRSDSEKDGLRFEYRQSRQKAGSDN